MSFLLSGVSPRASNLAFSVGGEVRSVEELEEQERKTVRIMTRRTVGSCEGKSVKSERRTWIVEVLVKDLVFIKSYVSKSS